MIRSAGGRLVKLIALGSALLRLVQGAHSDWGKASSENGEVCLDLPQGLVDWRALAIVSLGKERFEHPSRAVPQTGLQPEAGSSVAVRFEATFALTLDGQTTRFSRPDFATAGVSHVTIFRTDRQEAVALVEWDPGDGSTCGREFTLLILTQAGSRPPLHNGYDCDV